MERIYVGCLVMYGMVIMLQVGGLVKDVVADVTICLARSFVHSFALVNPTKSFTHPPSRHIITSTSATNHNQRSL